MFILAMTIDKSYFLNLLINNEMNDLILVVLNFLINMIYQITNFHIIAQIIMVILRFMKTEIIVKIPLTDSCR